MHKNHKKAVSRSYSSVDKVLRSYSKKKPHKIVEQSEAIFGQLQKDMKSSVKAYDQFLRDNHITGINDFAHGLDKDNYLRRYSPQDLSWDGKFADGDWVISATSGSTGEPYYFPRTRMQDKQYEVTAEAYLVNNFSIDKHKTLYVVAYPMGIWIGGVFTYQVISDIARKDKYDLTIVTPGIHKQHIIDSIKRLAPLYDQVIIGAYAPFLTDIIHDASKQGVNWKSLNVKFVFSAEAFPEQFRDYLKKEVGLKSIYKDTLNHYGTVDMGTMAHETPVSILIRRLLVKKGLLGDILPEAVRQPTLCQYDPTMFYFEEHDNTLYCSGYSGIPLIRYNLKDYGGVISYSSMFERLAKVGIDLQQEIKKAGLENSAWTLPFVYVYERNDFSVSYYAFNIYPEIIKQGLCATPLSKKVTGKFTMTTEYTTKGRQRLIIFIELLPGIKKSKKLTTDLAELMHKILLEKSVEYPEIFRVKGSVVKPMVELRDYEDAEYFRPGGKQKWIIK